MVYKIPAWKLVDDLYPDERRYNKPYVDSSIMGSRLDLPVIGNQVCRICKHIILDGERALYFNRTDKYEHSQCNRNKRVRSH